MKLSQRVPHVPVLDPAPLPSALARVSHDRVVWVGWRSLCPAVPLPGRVREAVVAVVAASATAVLRILYFYYCCLVRWPVSGGAGTEERCNKNRAS